MAEPVAFVYKPTLTSLDSITFDCTVREGYQRDSDITDHPVEQGANVADHARRKPDLLTLEAIFTDSPLTTAQNERAAESGALLFDTTFTETQPTGAGLAERSFQALCELQDFGVVFSVTTASRVYDNMMIQSISAPRDNKTGDAVVFTISMKQIKVVTNKLVKVDTREPKGKKKAKLGSQPAQEAKPETKKKGRSSVLYDGAESLGDAFGNKDWFKPGGN